MNTKRSPSRLSPSSQPVSPTPLSNESFQQKYITKWTPSDVSSFILGINLIPLEVVKELSNFVIKKNLDGKGFLRTKPDDLRKAGVNIKWCRSVIEALEAEKKRRVVAKVTRSQSQTGTHSPLGGASVCSEDETRSISPEFDNVTSPTNDEPVEPIYVLDIPTISEDPYQQELTEINSTITPETPTPDDFFKTIEDTIQERLELQRVEFDKLLNEGLIEQKASLEHTLHKLIHKEHDTLQEKLHQSFEEHQHCMKVAMQQQMSDYDQILREQTEDTLESQKFVLEKIIACKVEELKGLVSKERTPNGIDRWEEVLITMEKWKVEIQELKKNLQDENDLPNGQTFWSKYFGFFLTGLATGSLLGMVFFRYSR
ncbi:hypothetical protein K7432_006820 [Basidiobolus ranarum]|uniref:SAM domain-containing protein n=1 Tax=Basidiobolus ranarum TaxID=34480 RepID=A0ABR2W1Y1_9FUNG